MIDVLGQNQKSYIADFVTFNYLANRLYIIKYKRIDRNMTTATTTTATTNIQISIEKVIVLFASLIALTFSLHAQNIQDVLRVYVNGNGYSDEAIVRFHENATTGYDFDFDAYKMFSFNEDVPQIYTLANETEEFAINTLPSLTAETSVSLNVEVGISGTYSIRVNFSDFNDDVRVILEDSKNGNMVDLRAEMTYSTTFEVTDNADRFVLHFIPSYKCIKRNKLHS
jgi:hypothetical protein